VVACASHTRQTTRSKIVDDDFSAYTGQKWTVHATGYVGAGTALCHRAVLPIDDPSLSVDHINRIKLDNRSKNFRAATGSEQNYNQRVRCDRGAYTELCDSLGIAELPRYVRWDMGEGKFTFKDHPVAKLAERYNIPINTCGTKAESVTLVNKLRSCLMAALEAFKIVQGHGMDITDELDDVRVQLAAEYNGVVRAAHLHAPSKFPDGPYADLVKLKGSCQRAPSVFKVLLDTLPPLQPSQSMGGPRLPILH